MRYPDGAGTKGVTRKVLLGLGDGDEWWEQEFPVDASEFWRDPNELARVLLIEVQIHRPSAYYSRVLGVS